MAAENSLHKLSDQERRQGWKEFMDALREKLASGVRQAEIARRLNVDRSLIPKWLEGQGGKRIKRETLDRYRIGIGLPPLPEQFSSPTQPGHACASAPSTGIGRELAEIRRELEAVGADEDFIRAELRHWLQSKREGHYAQPASSLELSQAHAVHEPHAPYRGRPDLIVDIPGAPELHIFTDTDISGAASNRLSEMIQTAWHALGIPPLDCPSIPLHLSISADAPSIVEALRKAVSAKVEAARQFLGNESKNREFGRPNDETGEQQPPRDK